jgi:glutamate synthase (ferredoxin)
VVTSIFSKLNQNNVKKLKIQNPVISKEDLDKISNIDHPDFKAATISTLYKLKKGMD